MGRSEIEPTNGDLFAGVPEGQTFLAPEPNAPGDMKAMDPASADVRTGLCELLCAHGFVNRLAAQDVELIDGLAPRQAPIELGDSD
jgi:hypothetical protein